MNGQGKQPINWSTQGTIMRESFTVNNKPLHSRMHTVQGLEALSAGRTLRGDSKTSPGMLQLIGHTSACRKQAGLHLFRFIAELSEWMD